MRVPLLNHCTHHLLQANGSTPAKPLYALFELKNKTSPDENSVTADLARKATAKPRVREESESHCSKCQCGSVVEWMLCDPIIVISIDVVVHVRVH